MYVIHLQNVRYILLSTAVVFLAIKIWGFSLATKKIESFYFVLSTCSTINKNNDEKTYYKQFSPILQIITSALDKNVCRFTLYSNHRSVKRDTGSIINMFMRKIFRNSL